MKNVIENTKESKRTGFTIIEVVLVLAIAGLIFVMVFLAYPGMRRAYRDQRRRDDYGTFATSVSLYAANNNGLMPSSASDLNGEMLNSDGTDPYGNEYNIGFKDCTSNSDSSPCGISKSDIVTEPGTDTTKHQVYLVTHAECNGATPQYKTGSRSFVIYGAMENAPGTACVESNA